MRISASFHNNYGGKTVREINYYGSLEQAKRDLYYVEVDGFYYEWAIFENGKNGFDYEATYTLIKSQIPPGQKPYRLSAFKNSVRCECGSDVTGLAGHSLWCPKFVPFE